MGTVTKISRYGTVSNRRTSLNREIEYKHRRKKGAKREGWDKILLCIFYFIE